MIINFAKIAKKFSKDDWAILITIAALILGCFLRFYPALSSKYPLNDGGMFFTMINDLRMNGYSLPLFTTYNGGKIPFAYPPLPFYLAAGITDIFRLSVMDVLRFQPALFTAITLIVFYFFAITVFNNNKLPAALATTAYGFMPSSFCWLIMGGGLTRSLGLLFTLLAIREIYLLFINHNKLHLFFSMLTVALLSLSHPEAILHIIGFSGIIWLTKSRNKLAFIDGIKVGLGASLMTSIWWLPNILRHGLEPFIMASSTGDIGNVVTLKLFSFTITQEPLLMILAVLGFLGFWVALAERNYLFIGWMVVPFLLDPRTEITVAAIPLSLLVAIVLTDIIIPGLSMLENNHQKKNLFSSTFGLTTPIFLIVIFAYTFIANFIFLLQISPDRIDETNIQAMKWVNEYTQSSSRFIVLTGQPLWADDPINEWFPALTERNSLNTLQGQEWLLGKHFPQRVESIKNLQDCLNGQTECIEKKALALNMPYDYIYITKITPNLICLGNQCRLPSLWYALNTSPNYLKVYDAEGATIFKRLGNY